MPACWPEPDAHLIVSTNMKEACDIPFASSPDLASCFMRNIRNTFIGKDFCLHIHRSTTAAVKCIK
jgi:hypothetical protein